MLSALLPASVKAVLDTPIKDVRDDQFAAIMADLGFGKWHPEIRSAAIAMLRDKGVHTAADAIRDPEALMQLRSLVASVKNAVLPGSTSAKVCDFCGSSLVKHDKQFQRCSVCSIIH